MKDDMGAVVIGMDPHKRSVTIEVMTAGEAALGGGRFGTDVDGFAAMLAHAEGWPERAWAIEGCNGVGRHVANRLIAAGEQVGLPRPQGHPRQDPQRGHALPQQTPVRHRLSHPARRPDPSRSDGPERTLRQRL
jgi:hypothetical protein